MTKNLLPTLSTEWRHLKPLWTTWRVPSRWGTMTRPSPTSATSARWPTIKAPPWTSTSGRSCTKEELPSFRSWPWPARLISASPWLSSQIRNRWVNTKGKSFRRWWAQRAWTPQAAQHLRAHPPCQTSLLPVCLHWAAPCYTYNFGLLIRIYLSVSIRH